MVDTERTPTRRSGIVRAEAMYKTLQALGDNWHTRADIAAHLTKAELNMSEKAALDRLVEAGRIERRIVVTPHSEFNQRIEYRIVERKETP